MTTRLKLLSAFVVGTAAGILAGCQTYDFEPVTPLAIAQTTDSRSVVAKQLKPNMMILLDKSLSMDLPIACMGGSCPKRISEVRSAMSTFLGSSGTLARFGLMVYPSDDFCSPSSVGSIIHAIPNNTDVDSDSDLQSRANDIAEAIQNQPVGGGTPTADSLRALAAYNKLLGTERQDFVLLITDGLPNCNPNNPNDTEGSNAAQCNCTLADGTNASCVDNPNGLPGQQNLSALGCLDRTGSILAVSELRNQKIQTFVVGFGSELGSGSTGEEVLNALAEAGGFPLKCSTDADCPGGASNNPCITSSGLCTKRFYQTGNAVELAAALRDVAEKLTVADPCAYRLETTPSEPELLAVLVEGKPIARGATTWEYSDPGGMPTVRFTGDLCTKLSAATQGSPVALEFRIVESL